MTNETKKTFIFIGILMIGIIISALLSGTFLAMPQLTLEKRGNKSI